MSRLGAVGVEVEHLVDHGVEQVHIVRDDDEATLVVPQVFAQPHDGVGVEVVGRLVEEQRLGPGEQDPGEPRCGGADHPRAWPGSGRGGAPRARAPRRWTRPRTPRHTLRPPGTPRQAASSGAWPARAAPPTPRTSPSRRRGLSHDAVEPARGQDAVATSDVQVARARVLRQIADLARALHRPGSRLPHPGEHLGQGRLAGPVAPHETDAVTTGDAEGSHRRRGAVNRRAGSIAAAVSNRSPSWGFRWRGRAEEVAHRFRTGGLETFSLGAPCSARKTPHLGGHG